MSTRRPDGLEYWKSKDGWRWRVWRCGRITAESGEAYASRYNVRRAWNACREYMARIGDDG